MKTHSQNIEFEKGTVIEFFDCANIVKYYGVIYEFINNHYFILLFNSDFELKVHKENNYFRESKLSISQIIQQNL